MQSKELLNLADTIQGEVNRLCVTDDITELYKLSVHVENNIKKLCSMRYADFEKIHKEKPKNDSISRKAAIDLFLSEGMPTAAAYIDRMPPAEPKKKLTFSERQKVVREYQDWCLFNNAADCAESFLAYLCIKGFIDG